MILSDSMNFKSCAETVGWVTASIVVATMERPPQKVDYIHVCGGLREEVTFLPLLHQKKKANYKKKTGHCFGLEHKNLVLNDKTVT